MRKLLSVFSAVLLCAAPLMAQNPAAMLRDKAQEATIASFRSEGEGLYSIDYKADYRLQDFIDADINSQEVLKYKIAEMLLNIPAEALAGAAMRPGCTAFIARSPKGDVLYARNFDYPFEDSGNIIIRTSPKKAYRSLSMLSSSFIGIDRKALGDGSTDISPLIGAPLMQMDGMNAKGLAVSVLHLPHSCAKQYEEGKHTIMTSVMMRMLLDRCSTVDQAIEMLKGYNFFADGEQKGVKYQSNYHFFLADASGRSVVLEYIREDGPRGKGKWVMSVVEGAVATNFYHTPGWESAVKPDNRYGKAQKALEECGGVMTEEEAMALLDKVHQSHGRKGDSWTQWSVVYNLTRGTASVCIGTDFSQVHKFSIRKFNRR